MKFLGNPTLTTLDYHGKVALIVYTPDCNFSCPGCHARMLKEAKESMTGEAMFQLVKDYQNLDWVEGLVICGGEPTLQPDLINWIQTLKKDARTKNLLVKLDTNGSRPQILEALAREKLVDYVAMDVKAPPSLYSQVTGTNNPELIKNVNESLGLVSGFPDYEFRTTLFPITNADGTFRWMNTQDMLEMARWIEEATNSRAHKHYLQRFEARSEQEMVDPRFTKENLPLAMQKTPQSLLDEMKIQLRKAGYDFQIR